MVCANCTSVLPESASFCDNCGTAVSHVSAASPSVPAYLPAIPPQVSAPYSYASGTPPLQMAVLEEGRGKRVAGFLIDIVPALLLAVLNFLPIAGWMFHGLLSALYWLLRDVNGASLGKMAMGSVVCSLDGHPSNTGQRILRNVPLAIPGLLGLIPIVGIGFEVFAFAIFVLEAIMILLTGNRIGDRLAGTIVVKQAR